MEIKLEEAEWVQARYNQLNLIDEKRLAAICHGQLYQSRMKKAFDKRFVRESCVKGIWWLKRSYLFRRIVTVNGCQIMKVPMS